MKKTIGGITFNDSSFILTELSRNMLRDFFKEEEPKELVEKNKFADLFFLFQTIYPSYLPKMLIEFLLMAGIDFFQSLLFVPNRFFENCDWLESVEISDKMNDIGSNSFAYTNVKKIIIKKRNSTLVLGTHSFSNINTVGNNSLVEIIYEGTQEECKKYLLLPSSKHRNFEAIHCSDGTLVLN